MDCRPVSRCPRVRKGERMMGTPSTPGTLEPRTPWQSPAAWGWSWPACDHGAGSVPRKEDCLCAPAEDRAAQPGCRHQ